LARAFAEIVKELGPSDTEYGIIIVHTNSGPKALNFIVGQDGLIAGSQWLESLQSNGYTWRDVSSFVHSHNITEGDDAINQRNRAPAWSSGNIGDYGIGIYAQTRAQEQGANMAAWNSRYSQYIIGPEDYVAREFDGVSPHSSVTDGIFTDAEANAHEADANNDCSS